MRGERLPDLVAETDAFVEAVLARLAQDRPVRRRVPGGWLHIDRPLPFLCVERHRGHAGGGAVGLVGGQAAYLSVASEASDPTRRLVAEIGAAMADRFGAFLVVELWAGTDRRSFRVLAPPSEPSSTVAALVDALGDVDVQGQPPVVVGVDDPEPAPPGCAALVPGDEQRRRGLLLLGVEVPASFVDSSGQRLPLVLRRLQRDLTLALQRAVFDFATVQTSAAPEDVRALGGRRLRRSTRRADRELAELCGRLHYLLAVTPINAADAWNQFRDSRFRAPPTFRYRPLEVDPDLLKRELYAIPLEAVDDPTLAALYRAKRIELDRQICLLQDRDSPQFVHTSMQLFGGVDDELLALADAIHDRLPRWHDTAVKGDARPIDCHQFASRARRELDAYRQHVTRLDATVAVRDDVPGVLVSDGELLVGANVKVAARRVEALIHHEVGTHLVTAANGRAQPLQLLGAGLPGHEETQEALAVLAELIAGGLTADRLATLAARAVAVRRAVDGASFAEVFAELHEGRGLRAHRAFTVAMRVFRGGGLTKDVIYLRGFQRLLGYLAGGGSLDTLLVGKLALEQVPIVEELQWRQILRPAALRPRWLDLPDADRWLARTRAGVGLVDLVEEALL